MNQIYDKLLFGLALLVLVGSGAFYVLNGSGDASGAPTFQPQPVGGEFEPLVFVASPEESASWALPEAQSSGWVYDVFTPPKIYVNPETGAFTIEAIRPEGERPPFGIFLADVRRDLYRLQFQGFTETDLRDLSASIIYVFNTESNTQVSARVGRTYDEAGFEVRDFTIERSQDESGAITRLARLTLFDLVENRELTITQGEVIYDNTITVEFGSREHPDFTFEADGAGVSFENESGTFTILNINLENRSVTVEKAATEDHDAETKVLRVEAPSTSPEPIREETPTSTTPADPADFFDGLF